MRWQRIQVRGFQSLYDVDVELGNFTVIVGPSSSGKSAFIRAIKAVTSNLRGMGFISHGSPGLSVGVVTDTSTVVLEKGVGVNGYRVTHNGAAQTFTKLSGTVPVEVTTALGVPPVTDGSTWFAGQFDGPYLLNRPGSAVAAVMGGLSGVGVLRSAAREGARKALSAASEARAAQGTVERILGQVQAFRGLSRQVQDTAATEQALADVQALVDERDAVSAVVTKLERLAEQVTVPGVDVLPVVAEADAITVLVAELTTLRETVQGVRTSQQTLDEVHQHVRDVARECAQRRVEYTQMLEAAGTCPTCGQDTHEMAVVT